MDRFYKEFVVQGNIDVVIYFLDMSAKSSPCFFFAQVFEGYVFTSVCHSVHWMGGGGGGRLGAWSDGG